MGRPPVRLTRRGRIALFSLCLLVVGLLAALAAPATQAARPPTAPRTTVVQPGDTLWSVATRHAPGRDPFLVIEEIRRRNGISDLTIHPGQELVLP